MISISIVGGQGSRDRRAGLQQHAGFRVNPGGRRQPRTRHQQSFRPRLRDVQYFPGDDCWCDGPLRFLTFTQRI